MPNYRRNRVGTLFFFTIVSMGRRPIFTTPLARRLLREAIIRTQEERPWVMDGFVLLPEHIHTIWRLPEGDCEYSVRLAALKKRFTCSFLAAGGVESSVLSGQLHHRRRGVWQPRFWEHTIRDAKDFKMHMDYIHINPVKHGLVRHPADWPYSSFHRYVKSGWYEPDWCGRVDLPGAVEYFWPE